MDSGRGFCICSTLSRGSADDTGDMELETKWAHGETTRTKLPTNTVMKSGGGHLAASQSAPKSDGRAVQQEKMMTDSFQSNVDPKTKSNIGWSVILGIAVLVVSLFFLSTYPVQTVLVYVAYFAFAKKVWWPVVLIIIFVFIVGLANVIPKI